ncbi:MAG: AAA family ATPase [Pseudomonadota bacterium]|nr:AAA family ATPase [Pseudomonadota bacterium]
MYSHHFGLSQDPFSIAPDPRYLFMSERHREALAHLLYGVGGPHGTAGGTGGGFVLLTGDIGTGKTTICRCFLEQIPAGCHVAYIFNPKLTVTELLQSICEEFGIAAAAPSVMLPTIKNYNDALNIFLLQSHAAGQSSVLIIDEAQNLSADVLEQLRLLTNLETNERKLLQIVLIGQPELRAMLARPELEQLAQRVIARFHLDALTQAESAQYIAHRLAVAGHIGPLPFDRRALQRIHRRTRGVPRLINLLCGRALLGAWAHGLHRVNRAVVDKAAAEVFGTQAEPAPGARPRHGVYALGGLALLGGSALAGWLMLNTPHQAAALAPATATTSPATQARASTPVRTEALALNAGQEMAVTLPHKAAASSSATPTALATPLTTTSAAASPAPQAGASSPVRTEAPALNPVEEIEPLLAQLPGDINTAWRELAPTWKLSASGADPCQAASTQQLQCYRTNKLTVPLLRQLGRPGILTLQADGQAPVYALLVGLSEQTATLQVGASRHSVRLVSLGRLWRGEFATYWRPPPGYTAGLRNGSTGPAIDWLASQLALIDATPAPPASAVPPILDAGLKARVRAFQHAQGFKPDGKPGPITLMQISSATDMNEPRLQVNPR